MKKFEEFFYNRNIVSREKYVSIACQMRRRSYKYAYKCAYTYIILISVTYTVTL